MKRNRKLPAPYTKVGDNTVLLLRSDAIKIRDAMLGPPERVSKRAFLNLVRLLNREIGRYVPEELGREDFPEVDWKYEVDSGDTKLGLEEWRAHKVIAELADFLGEAHQEELANNHHGDGAGGCSYCEAIKRAREVAKS